MSDNMRKQQQVLSKRLNLGQSYSLQIETCASM